MDHLPPTPEPTTPPPPPWWSRTPVLLGIGGAVLAAAVVFAVVGGGGGSVDTSGDTTAATQPAPDGGSGTPDGEGTTAEGSLVEARSLEPAWLFRDPNRAERTHETWSIDRVLGQCANLWALSA